MISTALLTLMLAAEPAAAVEPRVTGGVMAPASLPSGTNALYGFVGAPDVGVGYRQGFGLVELEARGVFNIFEVSVIGEVGLKLGVFRADKLRLAPGVAIGLEANSGARYIDPFNFGFVGLRPRVALNASYDFTPTISGIAQFELPVSIALTGPGFQVTPLAGAGAEFHLGSNLSLLVSGHVGFDATKGPADVDPHYRVAWAGRLGIGYRVF